MARTDHGAVPVDELRDTHRVPDAGALGAWAAQKPRARCAYSSVPQTSASTIVSFWPAWRAAKLARR